MSALATAPAARRRSASPVRLAAIVASVFAFLCVWQAEDADAAQVSVSLQGNTVTFSGSGFTPGTQYTATITNTQTGSAQMIGPAEVSPGGTISTTTSTTGDNIDPGTTVEVGIFSAPEGEKLACGSATKPRSFAGKLIGFFKNVVKEILG